MPTANLPIIPATLPEGYCITDLQSFVNDAVGGSVVQFQSSSFTTIISSPTQPGESDRDKLWHDPDTGLFYYYQGGAWITPHPEAPSGLARRIFVGTLTQLQTYDGGEIGTVGDAAGPMWEEDTAFLGRSPMGAGEIPNTDPVKNLGVLEPYGEGAHTQTQEEVGPHTHTVWPSDGGDGNADKVWSHFDPGGESCSDATGKPIVPASNCPAQTQLVAQQNSYTDEQVPMPIIHPVVGVYIVKRTARIYYKGS